MPSFTILVDPKSIESRASGLSRLLGNVHSSSRSGANVEWNFEKGTAKCDTAPSGQTTELWIEQTATRNFQQSKDFLANLRSIFPEMMLKSELMERILAESEYYKFVASRGFVVTSGADIVPQQIEFTLTNSIDESEVVIAQDSANPARKQLVFTQSWTSVAAFVKDLVEPWLVGERAKLEVGEIGLPFFPNPPTRVLSESGENWLPLPCLVYSQGWSSPSRCVLDRNYAVVSSKRAYASIHHAYSVLFARSTGQLQFNCSFHLPEHRGRISRVIVEPKDTKFEAVVSVENPLALQLRVKLSCEMESGYPEVFEKDARDKEMAFEVESSPKEVRAELFFGLDLVDRDTWRRREVGVVATSIETRPGVVITTEIGLPVRDEVLVGAKSMVPAYARFFIMENTMRAVVKEKLVQKFSQNWVQKIEPVLLSGKSQHEQSRIKDVIQNTPDQLLDHVYYRDLKGVIDSFWSEFQTTFLDKDRTLMKLTELEDLRNDIAHNRVLSDHDIKRIEVYYMDLLSKT